jgi:hypothetical protein
VETEPAWSNAAVKGNEPKKKEGKREVDGK